MLVNDIIKKIRARKKTILNYPNHTDMVKYVEQRFKRCDDPFEECKILVLSRWINRVQLRKDAGVCAGCVGRINNVEEMDGLWFCQFYENNMKPECPVISFCSPMLAYDHVEPDKLSKRRKVSQDFIYPILLELIRELLDPNYKYETWLLYKIYSEVFYK